MNFFMGAPTTSQPQAGGNMLLNLLPLLLLFVVLYLFFFLPVQKKQKAHNKMLESLEKGDKVITSGGIVGVVQSVNKDKGLVNIKIADNVKIDIQMAHISEKTKQD